MFFLTLQEDQRTDHYLHIHTRIHTYTYTYTYVHAHRHIHTVQVDIRFVSAFGSIPTISNDGVLVMSHAWTKWT